MSNIHEPWLIYAGVRVARNREVQVGPVPSWEAALAVEEVMRERISELVAAEDLIGEVNGHIVGTERWDALHAEVLHEGLRRHRNRSGEYRE